MGLRTLFSLEGGHEAIEARTKQATGHRGPADETPGRVARVVDGGQRRAFERAKVPPERMLRFVASAEGVNYVEASILDISPGGIGILQAGPNVSLEAGMFLKGCRIEIPGEDPIIVDLEVRHTGPAVLADGTPAQRAGCRFLNLPHASANLLESVGQWAGRKC
ncbi:MAG TPA: PilZ domain-containing protein [Burkholderiales bacterium]|nr:PilZ domain-containing protein [Burkholderiales bacterium]